MLDWQILNLLASIVSQYQVEAKFGRRFSPEMEKELGKRVARAESSEDALFDLDTVDEVTLLLQADVSVAASFRTWDLEINRQTPDTGAMKRLLDVRYGHSTDDIPHADIFSS